MSDFFQTLSEQSSQQAVVSYFERARNATSRKAGNDARIGKKGSLSVKSNGAWFDFSAGVGGRGLFSAWCYEHYQTPNIDKSLLADAIDGAAREFGLTHLLHNTPQDAKRRADLQAAYKQRKQQEQEQRKNVQDSAAAEIASEQARAAAIAREIYAAAMPAKNHPYIEKKHLANISGLKEISGADLQQWRVKKKHTAGVVISDKTAARYLVIPVNDDHAGKDVLVNVQLIHENCKEKRFLQRGKKKGCYFYMAGNGATKGIAEGFATADAVRQCVNHGMFVAFDAGNLRHVADMVRARFPFSPVTIYADDDHHKHDAKGKPQNPGIVAAKKAGRGAWPIAFPMYKQPDGANTTDFNDLLLLEGKDAVRKAIRESIKQHIAHPLLTSAAYTYAGKTTAAMPTPRVGFRGHVKKYLSECADLLPWFESRRVSLLGAPTGSGKTDLASKLTGRVLVLFPTNPGGKQKARQYAVHYVAAGTQPNHDRVQFGTYDSILKFSADALADVTIVIDEAHDMIHCADKDFRGEMLGSLYAQLLAAKRVILLTGTPPKLLDALFPEIESAVITSDADAPLHYMTRRATTPQAALLAMHKPGQTTVFFRNNKQAARDLRDALVKGGYSCLCLDKQSVEDSDADADELRRHGRLTRHYDFLIITVYFAQAVDIYGVNVGAILFDADFPFYMRKQGVARFRDADVSGVEISMLERHARREYRAFMDADKNFDVYRHTGGAWSVMYNHTIDKGLFNADDFQTLSNIKGRVVNTFMRQDGRFVVNTLGCAYLVNKDIEHAARKDIRFEQELMAGYGMFASGIIEHTPDASEQISSAITQAHEDREQAFEAWLERIASMTEAEINACNDYERDKLLSVCMQRLRELLGLVGRDAAVNMMCDVRISDRKFYRMKRKIQNAQNAGNRVYTDIRGAFRLGEILDEPTKQARMRECLRRNAALRRLYDLPKSSVCRVTNNRITAILNDFCETLTHTVNGEQYTAVIAYTPIARFLLNERPEMNFCGEHEMKFRKKFAEFLKKTIKLFPPEMPTATAKTAASSAFLDEERAEARPAQFTVEDEERAAIMAFGG